MNNQNNQNLESLNTQPNTVGPVPPASPMPQNPQITPTSNLEPTPQGNPQPVNNIPPMGNVQPTGPVMNPTNMANNVNPTVGNNNSVNMIPPVESINLQPEGVVPPIPEATPQQPTTVEPLMSTPLTNNTPINQPMDNSMVNGNNMGMNNMNPNPNMMGVGMPNQMNNPMPTNVMGVPTPPSLPPEDGKKKKDKKANNKVVFIVLAAVLIIAVGLGVYYMLNTSKTKAPAVNITPLLNEVELGTTINKNSALQFAKVTGYNLNDCKVETNINANKVGTYEYTVTCGNKVSGPTKVQVKDTTPPEVTLKEVVVVPDTPVSAEDFVEDIKDASKYTISMEEKEIDTSVTGTYSINIIVSDDYDNQTEVVGTLIVDENAPTTYLTCEQASTSSSKITYLFGITNASEIYNTKKIITLEYEDEDAYEEAVTTAQEDEELDGYTGIFKFNDQNLTITITADILADDFDEEFDSVPTTEDDVQNIFNNDCYND